MRNYKCYGTKDGRMPMAMPDPADFGDSKYGAMALYCTADGAPVVIHRSITITPMLWCVQRGTSAVFFCTYKETMEHCCKRGYTLVE